MNKNKLFTLISVLAFSFMSEAFATDIFVADVSKSNSTLALINVQNITNRAGYDNQPSFSNDKNGLYYTAMFADQNSEAQQADIMFFDLTSSKHTRVTNTKNISEYSPTQINNTNALSMIIVEPDGTQRLWQTLLNQKNTAKSQRLINKSIKPVGYHAWGNSNDLLLFVLGDENLNQPMMLQYLSDKDQTNAKLIDEHIGRGLFFNKTLKLFSYSKQIGEEQILHSFNPKTENIKPLIALPNTNQDYAWLNDHTVISASGTAIHQWYINKNKTSNQWQVFSDLTHFCGTQISRLAVNKTQTKLAFVCNEE